jgi:hypothetical protein
MQSHQNKCLPSLVTVWADVSDGYIGYSDRLRKLDLGHRDRGNHASRKRTLSHTIPRNHALTAQSGSD